MSLVGIVVIFCYSLLLLIRWKYFSWAIEEINLWALKSYLVTWLLIISKWWQYFHLFILSTFKKGISNFPSLVFDGRIMFGFLFHLSKTSSSQFSQVFSTNHYYRSITSLLENNQHTGGWPGSALRYFTQSFNGAIFNNVGCFPCSQSLQKL